MTQRYPLLLITPTSSEYKPVKSAVAEWLAEGQVQLEMCGIGPGCAEAFAQRLDEAGPLGGLALLGWAGGLRPELAAGDIVLAEMALDASGQRAPCTALHLPRARSGTLLTVGEPLLTPEAKRAAQSSGALAVEMEAYPLAAWAAAHEVAFVHARVILDSMDDALPSLDDALDRYGRVLSRRLIGLLLAQPHLIMELWPMMQRLRLLKPTLGALAIAIVEAWSRQMPV
jgi:nucleoside phosphorylase